MLWLLILINVLESRTSLEGFFDLKFYLSQSRTSLEGLFDFESKEFEVEVAKKASKLGYDCVR
jgi:hypothetical protein